MKSAREILSFSGASFSGAAFVTVLRVRVVGALLTVFVVLALRAVLVCVVLRGLGFFSAASVTVAGVSDTGALSLSVIQNPEGSGDSSPDKRKIAALLSPGWEECFWGHQGNKQALSLWEHGVCALFFPWPAILHDSLRDTCNPGTGASLQGCGNYPFCVV